jgi:hypothetical protein
MLTVKSILTGALVFGAATVPAGVVVTDLATDSVPEAPGPIAIEAPALVPTGLAFEEPFVSAVLVPPSPAPVTGVAEPLVEVPELALEEVTLDRALIVRPAEGGLDRV